MEDTKLSILCEVDSKTWLRKETYKRLEEGAGVDPFERQMVSTSAVGEEEKASSSTKDDLVKPRTYTLPPRSFALTVTTTEPSVTSEMTREKA